MTDFRHTLQATLRRLNLLFLMLLASLSVHADETFVQLGELVTDPASGKLTLSLSTEGRDYDLLLQASQVTANTSATGSRFYQGTVIGDEASWVRLGINDNGVSGYLKAFGELLELDQASSLSNRHSLRKIEADTLTEGTDRVLMPPVDRQQTFAESYRSARQSLTVRAAGEAGQVSRVIRIGIVVDSRFDAFNNGNGLDKAINIINAVDGVYQEQFGLAIRLESAIVLAPENDPFLDMSGSIEQVLRAFRSYSLERPELSEDMGLLHLFTGSRDDNNIIGLSWINSVCRKDGYNVSVSTPFAQQMLLAAHEMGHNLGAVHDDDASCEVEYDKVMWPNISSATSSEFSGCSKNAIMPKLSASCNLDNIDLGISLSVTQQSLKKKTRTVRVSVNNNDTLRSARAVVSVNRFSTDTIPLAIPSACSYFADTMTCDHGTIPANAKHEIDIELSVPEGGEQMITSEIETETFADLSVFNNSASMDINNPTAVEAADNSTTQANAQSGGSGGGGGSAGILLFILLLSLSGVRNLRPAHEQHATKGYRS
ncbi:MAG: hypothetical protein KDJ38_15545 [Gammaproteobacteria bacterium]|nr:hypothetical protein [Gammaproteobacteria bacterium]